jgi:hypothetical protein
MVQGNETTVSFPSHPILPLNAGKKGARGKKPSGLVPCTFNHKTVNRRHPLKKKKLVFGDTELTIAELNTAQVEELITFEPPAENTAEAWKARTWRTILLGLNNAQKPPTKENPLGSDSEPLSRGDLQAGLGYSSINELHNEVLSLSGLRSAKPGESTASVGKSSTSSSSTAA